MRKLNIEQQVINGLSPLEGWADPAKLMFARKRRLTAVVVVWHVV